MVNTNILLESGTNELEIVEFYLNEKPKMDGEEFHRAYFGINVAKVLEIMRVPTGLTEMPEVAHPAVLGAFKLRDQVLPLIDLGSWLKKKLIPIEQPKVIVTEFNQVRSSFLVSGVTRIHRIGWDDVEAPNLYVSSLSSNSITGVVKLEGHLVFILDMEKIVAALNPQQEALAKPDEETKKTVTERVLKVLVADDSTMARKMMTSLMQDAGFKVTQASNGQEAWNILLNWLNRAKDESRPLADFVDAVVSDIEMPAMDGHNLTKRIKDEPGLRALPVVLCSSIITDTLFHKGEAVGADDQISKAELSTLPHRVLRKIKPVRQA